MVSPNRTEPSIYDEILGLQEQGRITSCSIRTILDQVDDDTREGLVRALSNPAVRGTIITKALERRGFHLSSHTVQRHRRGACGCAKTDGQFDD